jgi:hypothetical protein
MVRSVSWGAALALCVWAALPCSTEACSLCDSSLRARNTLREELEQAKAVLFGTISNPQLNKKPGAPPGSGITAFHVDRAILDDRARGGRTTLEVPNYLPVVDPANPPKYVFFCSVKDGQLLPYHGRVVKSDALLAYLAGILAVRGKDRTQQLQFFFQYLDHQDQVVSDDAFLEFARLNDVEVGSIARHLPVAKLRALLQDPKTPVERLGLFAFLLGASGNDKEAAGLLRHMLVQPTERTGGALDGLLSGYIHLQPREGWDLTAKILGDNTRPFNQRQSAIRALRFYQAWKPAESKKEIMRCMAVIIADGEIADFGIEDLRQWKAWDLTPQVLALYGKASHDSPLARRGIVRYALSCPQPEARQFIAALRQRDPDLVREQEENLEFEKGK